MPALAEQYRTQATAAWDDLVADLHGVDFAPLLEQYLTDFEELHWQYFRAETDPARQPWEPLSPRTIQRKGHDEILIDTERLIESLKMRTADSVRSIGKDGPNFKLEYGTRVPYSGVHQRGATRTTKSGKTIRIPKREHVGINTKVLESIVDDVIGHMLDAV